MKKFLSLLIISLLLPHILLAQSATSEPNISLALQGVKDLKS
jgi:hypothetical protein